jgi:hypothetical protein
MIEHEEIGLVVAENREERVWIRVKDNVIKLIENLEDDLLLQREVLKLCEKKLNDLKSDPELSV